MARTPRRGGKLSISAAHAFPKFAPMAVSGCELWLDFTDIATYDVAEGGRPGNLYDKSGNGHHFAQATAGLRSLVTRGESGDLCLSMDGQTQFYDAIANWHLNACSIVVVSDGPWDGANTSNEIVSKGPGTFGTPSTCCMCSGLRSVRCLGWTAGGNPADSIGDDASLLGPEDRCVIATFGPDGGSHLQTTIYIDGKLRAGFYSSGSSSNPKSSSSNAGGALDSYSNPWRIGQRAYTAPLQTFRHVAIYDHALSTAEVAQIQAMVDRPVGTKVVIAGNSIADAYSYPWIEWSTGLKAALGVDCWVYNGAKGGVTLSGISNLFAGHYANRVPSYGPSVFVLYEFTNALRSGSAPDAATAITQADAIGAAAKAAGYTRCVLFGCLPGENIDPTKRAAINAYYRAGLAGTPWDAFIDVESDPIGVEGAQNSTTYYFADGAAPGGLPGLHPNAAGHARLLALAAPVIRGVMAT